jgi:Chlorophyllase enzyme
MIRPNDGPNDRPNDRSSSGALVPLLLVGLAGLAALAEPACSRRSSAPAAGSPAGSSGGAPGTAGARGTSGGTGAAAGSSTTTGMSSAMASPDAGSAAQDGAVGAGSGGARPRPAEDAGVGMAGGAGNPPSGGSGTGPAADGSAGGTPGAGASGTGSGAGAGGGTSLGGGGGGDVGVAPGPGWPAVTDFGAPGPFATVRDTNTGPGGAYDVFHPASLGADHRKHPIVSWANGTLYSVDDYAPLLTHWASHGFVVIAGHTNTTAGGATHKAGIDWLVAESTTSTSPYFGVLDPTRIGAAGHSQGGGATIAAGSNKPGVTGITTTLPLMPLLSFESDKTIVAHQLVPMFNVNATMDNRDPTGAYATQIYDGAVTELVQASFIGVHEDAMNAKMHAPTVAWFRWKLMDDTQAKAMFYPGATCLLCQNPDWQMVRYKNPAP